MKTIKCILLLVLLTPTEFEIGVADDKTQKFFIVQGH